MRSISSPTRLTVAVDLAILTVIDGAMRVLLLRRPDDDVPGWAMPGGVVDAERGLDETVQQVLVAKTGVRDAHFEQLATYGAVNRDPRGRVISVAYLALCPHDRLEGAVAAGADQMLAHLHTTWPGEQGGPARLTDAAGQPLSMAFDHADILGDLVRRLRGKLDYSLIAFGLLHRRFTLRDVQTVHEAILGHPLAKPAFRRKLLSRGLLKATGDYAPAGAHRPAELYELLEEK
ncbi:MAG: NUDIX domain-containing protein [Minwuia sp.]|nr:NUDIX domain-containing protein [Minwuia sp.]